MEDFLGVRSTVLSVLVKRALASGSLILMKSADRIEDRGKTPETVMAEQLVKALVSALESMDAGTQH